MAQIEKAEQVHVSFVFIILHLFIYPASNGYNSYHDRDTGPIGLVPTPLPITKYLLPICLALEAIGLVASSFINIPFAICIFIYILGSHLYSHRNIRIKQYPILSYASVMIVQGLLVYWAVQFGCRNSSVLYADHLLQSIISMCIIGAVYPLTQIYQHEQDRADGVTTISYLLGVYNTFYLAMIMMAACGICMYFLYQDYQFHLLLFFTLMIPTILMLFYWFFQVRRDKHKADFKHTMIMSIVSSACTNVIFLIFNFIQ